MTTNNNNERFHDLALQKAIKMGLDGLCESVTIRFKNRKMNTLEMVKVHDVKRKITDIVNESKYQDIMVKTSNGKVAVIKSTVKIKLAENSPSIKGTLQADSITVKQDSRQFFTCNGKSK
ncbi:hypothetical protein LVD17_03150 [Fulvivirga ulvae]|uniref:hypothetical protein n=1 Tax=Fulvivirga ulvae TaxID=2904245 RepID=UPI001F3FACF0|nr:hypothetical protein [Fulvivirga ulvae]UII32829.1 hypothetical protein LVD17_03150 [Fulvivirga ulvae]